MATYNNVITNVSGSVGIGTTSATARLIVSGSTANISEPIGVFRPGVPQANATAVLDVQNNAGSTILFVTGSGRIGVGTNTPRDVLEVNGQIRINDGSVNALNYGTGASNSYLSFSGGTIFVGNTNTGFTFRTSGNSSAVNIDNSGNVGINTATIGTKLHVNGIGELLRVVDSSSSNIRVSHGTTNSAGTTYGFIQTYQDNTSTAFGTLTLQHAAGSVGIGTINPATKLSVYSGAVSANYGVFSGSLAAYASPTGALYTYWNTTSNYGTIVSSADNSNNPAPMQLRVGGNLSIHIDTSGNVGIQTTSVGAKLDIAGNTAGTEQAIFARGASDPTFRLSAYVGAGAGINSEHARIGMHYSATQVATINFIRGGSAYDSSMAFTTNQAERMRINDAGNVGIGTSATISARLHVQGSQTTTTPTVLIKENQAMANAVATLDVQNSAGTSLLFVSGSGIVSLAGTTHYGNGKLQIINGDSSSGGQVISQVSLQYFGGGYSHHIQSLHDTATGDGNSIRFHLNTSSTAGGSTTVGTGNALAYAMGYSTHRWNTGGSEKMRLDSGNLLVGATSLATGFSGFAQIEASSTTGGVLINSATGNIGRLIFTNNNASGGEGLIRYDGSNQAMQFWTNALERMRIDGSGNVGIGTTNPGYAASNRQVLYLNATTSNVVGFGIGGTNVGYLFSDNTKLELYAEGTREARVTTGGAGPVILSTASSERVRVDSSGNVGIGTTNTNGNKVAISGGNLSVTGSVIPGVNGAYDLGNSSYQWANVRGVNIYGTLLPTNLTQGSVLFISNTGAIAQNNSNFFWDNANTSLGIGTNVPFIGGGLELAKGFFRHNRVYTTVVIPSLGGPATYADSNRYEVARLGIDYNDWNTVGVFEIEVLERYWSSGFKKKYYVWYGYTSNSGVYLAEVGGSGNAAYPNDQFQVVIGSEVTVTGDQRYIPVYVDVSYYTTVDVVIRTNRVLTSTNPPPIGYTYINSAPSGAATGVGITQARKVFINNVYGYDSFFQYANVGIGTTNTNGNRLSVNGVASISGSVLPGDNGTSYDLGSTSYRWRTLFAANISGSLTPTGATAGSVFFAGSSGQIQQDNAKLFWDDTNNRLGIGTNTSLSYPLTVVGPSSAAAVAYLKSPDTSGAALFFGDSSGILGQLYVTSTGTWLDYNTALSLRSGYGGTTRFLISSTGVVGVGTSTTDGNRIVLGGVGSATSYVKANETAFQVGNIFAGSLSLLTADTERVLIDSSGNVSLRQNSNASNTSVSLNTTVQNAMTLDSSGNLGVGRTSIAASATGQTIEASGCVITGGPLNSHQTSRGVFEYNTNIVAIRAYGATTGTGQIQLKTGGGGGNADLVAMTLNSSGHTLPGVDNGRDLGASGTRWRTLYAANISGSLTPTGATAGSVFFAGGSGQINQDNANFFWDDTNNRLGVGTNAPSNPLHIYRSGLADGSTNTHLLLDGKFAPASVDSNDIIGISSRVENNSGGSQTTFNIGFSYQAAGNALLLQPSSGNVGVGTNNPLVKFAITGRIYVHDTFGTYTNYGWRGNFYNVAQGKGVAISYDSDSNGHLVQGLASGGNGDLGLNYYGGNVVVGATATSNGQLTVYKVGTGNVELLTLKTTYPTDSTYKALTWRDITNITGQIDTRFDNITVDMVFGSLYNGGYNSTERMRIKGNGNIGIGTSTFTARLFVSGSSTASTPTMIVREGVVSPTGGALTFEVENSAGATLFSVSGSGNVGVGTSNASGKFEVVGTSGSLMLVTDSLSGSLFSVNDVTGLPIFEVFSDDTVVAGAVNTNALVVTGSLVGIGTRTPTNTLMVSGTLRVTSVSSATGDFATYSATGVLQKRTASEVKTDIGLSNVQNLSVSQIFNNTGATHGTRNDFNGITDFGYQYVQGTTNGPNLNSATQYYAWTIGLGSEYPYSQYAAQFALPRSVSNPYMGVRYREATTWGAWQKLAAGNADTLTTTRTIWGQNFNGSANVSGNLTSVGNITGTGTIGINPAAGSNVALNTSGTGATIIGGLYYLTSQSIALSVGTDSWVRLATVANLCDLKLIVRINSTNTEECINISIKGNYYNVNTKIDVDRVTYAERLREVYIDQPTVNGGNKTIYLRVRSSSTSPTVTWYLYDSTVYPVTVHNDDTTGSPPTSGVSVVLSTNINTQQVTNANLIVSGTSSPKVGIGTSDPGYRLHVWGLNSSTPTGVRFAFDQTYYQELYQNGFTVFNNPVNIIAKQSYEIAFSTNSIERARIDSVGNVGIGTTNTNGNRVAITGGNLSVTGSVLPGIDSSYDLGNASYRWANIRGVNIYGNLLPTSMNAGSVLFINGSGAVAQDNANFFWDDTNNRLVLGSTVARTKMQVGARVNDDNNFTYDSDSLMVVHQTATSTTTLNDPKTTLVLARQGTGGQAYGAAATFNLSRYENSSVNSRTRLDLSLAHASFDITSNIAMTWLSSGNVGIGTTSPSKRLVVHGSDALINDVTVGRGGAASNVSITNTALGYQAGLSLTTTYTDNTSIGNNSLYASTTGQRNTAVGSYTLYSANTNSPSDNVAIGFSAMRNGTTMDASVAVGVESMSLYGGSNYNVGVGYRSGYSLDKANYVTAVGSLALYNMRDLDHATAVGYGSLYANTGSYNTAVGGYSLLNNTSAAGNTAVGYAAGLANTTSTGNVYFGYYAGASNQTGDRNTAVGYESLYSTTGADNIGLGYQSGRGITSGIENVAIGYRANYSGAGGASNVSIGYESLLSCTVSSNTTVGTYAGRNFTTGGSNTAIGAQAGQGAIGSTAQYNTFIGAGAGTGVSSGGYNTFLGNGSGGEVTTGVYNVILGSYDGNNSSLDMRTGNRNIVLSDGEGNIRARFDYTGAVGIGTASPIPGYTVTVTSGSTANAIDLDSRMYLLSTGLEKETGYYMSALTRSAHFRVSMATTGVRLGSSTSDPLYLQTNNTTALVIDTSQNVGIGTESTGGEALRVYRSSGVTTGLYSNTGNATITTSGYNSTTAVTAILEASSTVATLGTSTNHPLRLLTNSTEAMRIDTSQRVGIGTTAPSEKLEAFGTDAGIIVHYSGQSRGGIWALSSARVAFASTTSGDDLVFGYTGSPGSSAAFVERMRVDNSTGYVGIGTATPSSLLHVHGETWIYNSPYGGYSHLSYSTTGDNYISSGNDGSVLVGATYIRGKSVGGSSIDIAKFTVSNSLPRVGIGTNAAYYLQIGADSAAKTNGGSWSSPSDFRLKKDIVDLTGSLDLLLSLKGKRFVWRTNNEEAVGFIAQETESLFPNWVKTVEISDDSDEAPYIEDKKMKVFNVGNDFYAYCVEAMRDLKNENDSLKSEIQSLKDQISSILTMLSNK